LKNRLIPHLIRWFYPWADRVVAVSKAARDDLIRTTGVPADLVTTIYNPVVTDELIEKAQEHLDHPWFAKDAPPVILGVGRLESQKDFGTLIRAFYRIRSEREARLVILGEGSQRAMLNRLVQTLGMDDNVQMPGFVNNPFKYMARANAFVLSSRFEGLPGVLIQAMATGCPVVSTDCPSGPREILEGERWGTLVPVGDEEALATAVLQTMDAPRRPDELRARAQYFSASRAVDQYLDALLG
jgi:glycosyltransferase involved in cell wall biosynthesis